MLFRSEAAGKERVLDSTPPPTLVCTGGGGSQGDEEAHASSSAAEELSPAPSENSKASPEKDSLGKQSSTEGSSQTGRQTDRQTHKEGAEDQKPARQP